MAWAFGSPVSFESALHCEWDSLPFLSGFDPYAEKFVPTRDSMAEFLQDIGVLELVAANGSSKGQEQTIPQWSPGVSFDSPGGRSAKQVRGLARFRAMAEFCRDTPCTQLCMYSSLDW